MQAGAVLAVVTGHPYAAVGLYWGSQVIGAASHPIEGPTRTTKFASDDDQPIDLIYGAETEEAVKEALAAHAPDGGMAREASTRM